MKSDSDTQETEKELEESLDEDFEKEVEGESSEEQKIITRAPLPRGREIIGILEQRYGGNKMKINCLDGKERNCRVPGRLKRKMWLRPGDIVLIEPWELDNSRGDVLLKYSSSQIEWLKRKGYLKNEKEQLF